VQGAFQLSKFQDGVLPAAFMVGLLVASVVYSELCKHCNAFRLIGRSWQEHSCMSCHGAVFPEGSIQKQDPEEALISRAW